MNGRLLCTVCTGTLLALSAGCGPSFGPQAQYGITFYCPGAGNIDFGDHGVREGLERAGYRGQVASVAWTVSLNPAIDQTLRLNARLAGTRLAGYIEQYYKEFPDGEVNIVGLSAGSGVAIWALEDLKSPYTVKNVILLSSSLNHKYDVGKALRRVRGKIYNYYSSEDPILAGPMKVFGTIDGVFFVDGAGAVGLHSPKGAERIVNIPWRAEFKQYGYHGHHTDVTSPAFVRAQISQHITAPSGTAQRETGPAIELAQDSPRARRR